MGKAEEEKYSNASADCTNPGASSSSPSSEPSTTNNAAADLSGSAAAPKENSEAEKTVNGQEAVEAQTTAETAETTQVAGDAEAGAAATAQGADASAQEVDVTQAGDAAQTGDAAGEQEVEAEVIDPLAQAQEALEAAKADAAAWQDKYVRLHAEWDTYRRRMNEQREAEKARATEKLVTSLIPVIDDFERTIDYAMQNGEEGLLGGVKAVHTKIVDVLSKDGVCVIDPAGEAFDALEAQAVATVEDTSVPDETVAQVYQKGYKMGTKVLRPAMVTITSGGPKRPKEKQDQENE
jgi:molecular chaperone GrpE